MSASLLRLEVGLFASCTSFSRGGCTDASATLVACRHSIRAPVLKSGRCLSISSNGDPRIAKPRGELRRKSTKSSGADSNQHSPVEVMDPKTGEYTDAEISWDDKREIEFIEEEDEPFSFERNEELLKKFGPSIGIKYEEDTVEAAIKNMRNPVSYKIVQQLEEGIEDIDDLLKTTYGHNPDIKKLYTKVDSLIRKRDESSARDLVEGNYVALLEQINGGVFGIEQLGLFNVLASLYLLLKEPDAAYQLLDQARDLLKDIPETEEAVDNVLEHTASLYMKLKNPHQALPLYARCLSLRKASGKDIPSIVKTLMGLADAYGDLNEGAKCTEMYRQVLAYTEDALGPENEDLVAPLLHLGSSLMEEDKLDEAEMAAGRAVKLTEKAYGSKDGRCGVAVCVLARIKAKQGEMENAAREFQKGLKMLEDSQDYNEPTDLDIVRMDAAALLSVMDRVKDAQVMLARVSHIANRSYFSHQQVEYLRILAEGFAAEGELEKAERALRHSLQILLDNVGPDAVHISIVLQLLAALLHAQPDRQSEAVPLVRESIRIREKRFGKHHLAVGEAYCFLASILQNQDQVDEALDLMYKVLHIQEREYGYDSPQLIETLEILNVLLEENRRYQETSPVIQRLEELKAQSGLSFRM